MLEDFKSEQPILFHILSNEIMNNKISHAYMFDVSSNNNFMPFIYAFIKSLLCPKHNISGKCMECNICKMIEDKMFPDIVLIEPDGSNIKKEQLLELQASFKTKSLYNSKKIYIIKYAENLNQASSNTILKFLEEPEEDIIAILLTKNINEVITTIVSRCQQLSFLPDKKDLSIKEKIEQVLLNEMDEVEEDIDIENLLSSVLEFAKYFETRGIDVLAHTQNLWFEYFKDKQANTLGYVLLTLLYKDIINVKLEKKTEYYSDINTLKLIAEKNTLENLSIKLRYIVEASRKNKLNINLALNLDNLIIEMDGVR